MTDNGSLFVMAPRSRYSLDRMQYFAAGAICGCDLPCMSIYESCFLLSRSALSLNLTDKAYLYGTFDNCSANANNNHKVIIILFYK